MRRAARTILTGGVAVLAMLAGGLAGGADLGHAAAPTAVPAAAPAAPAAPAAASPRLDNGVGRTPAMGWNDWYSFGCDVSATLVEQTARTMVSSGMKAAGYQYVNLDDCWMSKTRNADGSLQPDPKKFPGGIKPVADYVHKLGLKLGIYEDVGTETCAGYPGSLGHAQQDANSFAAWGVDFAKIDWCNVPYDKFPGMSQQQIAKKLYTEYSQALRNTGRPILFSICEWDPTLKPWTWAPGISNMWRSNFDYNDDWPSVLRNLDGEANNGSYAGPGAVNDPDILQIGRGMSHTEDQAQMSIWSVLAAPLLAGNDVRTMSPETKAILTNRSVIAVDQDRLGVQGRRIARRGDADVWSKPLANGDRAVLLLNRGAGDLTVSTTTAQVGLPARSAYRVTDLWTHKVTQSNGTLAAGVPAHSAVLLRVSAAKPAASTPPQLAFSVAVPRLPGTDTPVVPAGKATKVTATFTDAGRTAVRGLRVTLSTPDGWTVTPSDPATASRVAGGSTFTATWKVTAPTGTTPGTYAMDATSTYRLPSGRIGVLLAPLTVTVPQLPSGSSVKVSDLTWISSENGFGPVLKNKNYQGDPLTIRGTVYPDGLWMNATAAATYYLGANCSRFTGTVGIDDVTEGKGSVTYQVWADNAKVYDSGVVTGSSPAKKISVSTTGAKTLRLIVTDGGDDNSFDNADWGSPRLTCG